MDTSVAIWIGIFNNIFENMSVNKVLSDVITVTADMDVSNKLQLNRIPDINEFRSMNGASRAYLIHKAREYRCRNATITNNAGNIAETKLTNIG